MTAMETLNPYLDINNYERAQDVVSHVRVLTHEKTYADGLSVVILNLDKPELIIPLIKG